VAARSVIRGIAVDRMWVAECWEKKGRRAKRERRLHQYGLIDGARLCFRAIDGSVGRQDCSNKSWFRNAFLDGVFKVRRDISRRKESPHAKPTWCFETEAHFAPPTRRDFKCVACNDQDTNRLTLNSTTDLTL
jgi:hypothetical protein